MILYGVSLRNAKSGCAAVGVTLSSSRPTSALNSRRGSRDGRLPRGAPRGAPLRRMAAGSRRTRAEESARADAS